MSSLIPGTRTAGSLSGPRNPCTVRVIGSPNAVGRICREDLAWTVIICLMSLAMRRFIRGFFVGVEYFVTCRLSCASIVTSMLGMAREDEDVNTEVGTVVGGESKLSDSDEDEEE